MLRRFRVALCFALLAALPAAAQAPIVATARAGAIPAWNKGILPINSERYYAAIECGKQGGQDPPCVFWDTGLCKNPDFAIAMYTGYKAVAYEVWQAVSRKQPAPQPNYQAAQQTRVTIGITPVRGSTNAFTGLSLKRAGKEVTPVDRSLNGGGGRYTFDYPTFAPTASLRLDMAGKTQTISCTIAPAVLAQFR